MAAATANLSMSNPSSFNYGVIYWEWLQDTGNWQPYDPEVVTFIEQNYGKTNFASLGAITPSLSLYKIDFTSNPPSQIRMDTGRKRCVRRRVHPVANPTNHQYIWKWEGDFPGIWNTYDFDVSTMIEDVYQAQKSHFLDLSQTSLKMPYFIDLKNLQQVRIETGKCRGIRREQLNVPYPMCNSSSQLIRQPVASMILNQNGHIGAASQLVPSHQNHANPCSSNTVSYNMYGSNGARNNNSTFSSNIASGKHNLAASDSSDSDDGSNSNNPLIKSACKRLRSASYRNQSSALTNGTVSMSNSLQSSNYLPSNMVYNFGSLASSPLSVSNMIGSGRQVLSNLSSANSHNAMGNQPMPSTSTYSNPIVLQQSSGSLSQGLYPSQYTGMLTSSPFLNSLSNSSTTANSSLSYSSSGPLTRQQFTLLQYRTGIYGSGNLPSSSPAASSNLFSGVSNGMMNLKGHGSKITPVVSNITNVLTSPIVPAAFSQQSASLPGNFQASAGFNVSSYSSPSFPDKNRIVLPKLKKSKGGKSGTEMPIHYLKPVVKPAEDEDCCICCEKLNTESAYGKSNHPDGEVISLSLCGHMFHRQCLQAMYDSGPKDGSVQCPSCKKIHGYKHGVCPAGEMCYWIKPDSLPGCEGCSTICVSYSIRPGTQGPEHPNPGKKFSARGFPRTGYLPNDEKGRKVLKLFTIAWKRRIMFTIGTSSTTGETDTVTWNEIHHKTEFNSNDYGHGYPDPNYLDNVMLELAVQGVTEDDLNDT